MGSNPILVCTFRIALNHVLHQLKFTDAMRKQNASRTECTDRHPASLRGTGRGGGRDTQLHPTTLTRVGLRQEHGDEVQTMFEGIHSHWGEHTECRKVGGSTPPITA